MTAPLLLAAVLLHARTEEREAIAAFGDAYRRYAARVPAFFPHVLKRADASKA